MKTGPYVAPFFCVMFAVGAHPVRDQPRSGLSYVVIPAKVGQARSAQNACRAAPMGERSESSGDFRSWVDGVARVPPTRRSKRPPR